MQLTPTYSVLLIGKRLPKPIPRRLAVTAPLHMTNSPAALARGPSSG
jgi:hypothetical protein